MAARSVSSKGRKGYGWRFWKCSATYWTDGVREYWVNALIQHSIAPTLHSSWLLLAERPLQRSILAEGLRPTYIFLKIRPLLDQILNDVLDSLVGNDGRGLEETSIRPYRPLSNRSIFFAHPLRE